MRQTCILEVLGSLGSEPPNPQNENLGGSFKGPLKQSSKAQQTP